MAELKVKVPIKFSDKAQKALYETCMAYKELAEVRGAENAKLREDIAKAYDPQRIGGQADPKSFIYAIEQLREFRWQHATNDEDAIPYINKVAEAHERESAKLREQIELLTTILRNDCDIDASWDGLRRFWSIELTESGCLMRDRACKAEAENAKLRKFAESYLDAVGECCDLCPYDDVDLCDTETDPMRDGCRLYEEMRELGVEVNV